MEKVEDIYQATDYLTWDVNRGDKTIHARRVPGRFRTRQWLVYLFMYGPYFLLPYLTWDNRQAILFDIPNRKFYLFNFVIWPQDLWVLALLLLFCFVLLFAMTSLSGRVFCGFMCPHSTWVNFFTFIEDLVEGPPNSRIKLEQSGWTPQKIAKKSIKHFLWLVVCVLTAVTFVGYFSGIYYSWGSLFHLAYSNSEWVAFIFAVNLFYMNAGFVREQFCMWVCPYARIQGVLTDIYTRTTTYDEKRGEPRASLKDAVEKNAGDCIDCKMCVAVCPTGVDIRKGQQLGCINCGFCIDACDSVMKKISRATGLIKFASKYEMDNPDIKHRFFLRTRPIVYSVITVTVLGLMIAGLLLKKEFDLNVRHERDPVFTMMSDGSIQNIYHLKLLNKSEDKSEFKLEVNGPKNLQTNLEDKTFKIKNGEVRNFDLAVRAPSSDLTEKQQDLLIIMSSVKHPDHQKIYKSMFIGPDR